MADESLSATTIIGAPAEAVSRFSPTQPSTPPSTAPDGSANPSTASR